MHDAGRLAGSLYVTTVYATLIDNNRPLLQCITSLRIQLWHENDSLQCVNYFTLIGKNIHKTVDNKWSIYILYVGRAIEQICKRLASNFTSKGDCHCVQKPFYNWCSHAHFIGRIVIQTLPVGLVKSDCMRACMQLERVQMLHFCDITVCWRRLWFTARDYNDNVCINRMLLHSGHCFSLTFKALISSNRAHGTPIIRRSRHCFPRNFSNVANTDRI